jgi:thiol-disulfide isomerase/thioredoxin
MKLRLVLPAALAAAILISGGLRAQAPAAAPSASEEAAKAVAAELSQLVEQVKAKLNAGKTTEADLKPELAAFDALSAKHAAEKTDEVAMIGLMKARLYLEVFKDSKTGIAQLKQLKADFPATQLATKIDPFIANLEAEALAEETTAVGKTFTPFAEKDLSGAPLALPTGKGKVVLVDFWATWCGPCVAELPNVIAAYQKYHDRGFEIVGVSLDKDRAALDAFIAEHKMTWPQYFDGRGWENKLAQAYGIHSIPATFLLDGEGKIIAKGLRGEALGAKIGELLGVKG